MPDEEPERAGATTFLELKVTGTGSVGQGTSPYPVEDNEAVVAAAQKDEAS